jgi:hypothetical protein
MNLRKIGFGSVVVSSGSGLGPVAGCCEGSNDPDGEPSSYMKGGKFLE